MEFKRMIEELEPLFLKKSKEIAKIEFVEEKTKITDSKIQGIPYLPKGNKIPISNQNPHPFHKNDVLIKEQLTFLAQINFEDLPKLEGFPTKGILQFWHLNDGNFGIDEIYVRCDKTKELVLKRLHTRQNNFKVIYYPTIEEHYSEEEFLEMYKPARNEVEDNFRKNYNLPLENPYFLFADKNFKMKFTKGKSYEDVILLAYDVFQNSKELVKKIRVGIGEYFEIKYKADIEEYFETKYEDYDTYGHNDKSMINGIPCFTQDEPRTKEEQEKYNTLLFQLNSDYIKIGDCGIMNFFINDKKLKEKDFSDIFFTWDCT